MINLAPGTKVFLACRPIDLRNGFDGLAAKAKSIIGAASFSGHLFLFRGKRGDYPKSLCWDGSGPRLFAKRLEKGKFVWPPVINDGMVLSPAQLALTPQKITPDQSAVGSSRRKQYAFRASDRRRAPPSPPVTGRLGIADRLFIVYSPTARGCDQRRHLL